MRKFLSDKRKDMLATYALNISVASLAVAVFEGALWGMVPAVIAVLAFLVLTEEEDEQ